MKRSFTQLISLKVVLQGNVLTSFNKKCIVQRLSIYWVRSKLNLGVSETSHSKLWSQSIFNWLRNLFDESSDELWCFIKLSLGNGVWFILMWNLLYFVIKNARQRMFLIALPSKTNVLKLLMIMWIVNIFRLEIGIHCRWCIDGRVWSFFTVIERDLSTVEMDSCSIFFVFC